MRPVVAVVGPLASAVANNICLSQSPTAAAGFTLNGSLVTSGVAILDVARRVLFTFAGNETGHTITLTGTDRAGQSQSETIAGTTAGTVASVLDYKTVTSIAISANSTAAITVGTNGVAASAWVRMDEWANAPIGLACVVSGTVNYTVQQTFDDPNSPTDPVAAASVTWQSSGDTNVVGATATKQSSFSYVPTFVRVLLNSGTGTVTTTISQPGVVPY